MCSLTDQTYSIRSFGRTDDKLELPPSALEDCNLV